MNSNTVPQKVWAITRDQAHYLYRGIRNAGRVVWYAIHRYGEVQASEAAAAITYYTLFSLFPLLLLLIVVASSILKSPDIQDQVMKAVGEFFPGSQELVASNIQQVLQLRSTVGAASIVGLLWGATGVFSVLTQNISEAWRNARRRHFVKVRLISLLMVGSLVGLLVLAQVLSTATNLLSRFDIPVWGSLLLQRTDFWRHVLKWTPVGVIFTAFFLMYWWGPNTRVRWQEAFWGALVTTLGWELLKRAFVWYLASGFARQRLVYGSLGAVIALMLWIYLSSQVILFGAHISAAIGHFRELEENERELGSL
ncbi:MAG: YihY/virulence factor BrkB family protein [Chloroflexi bacterium]|nr:MAG: YihY/virulence factor BrkB family protein [Chloroflexota bacterium]